MQVTASASGSKSSSQASRTDRVPLPPEPRWLPLLQRELDDDIGTGDLTSQLSIPAALQGRARLEAREGLVVCGIECARAVFRTVDPSIECELRVADGEWADASAPLLYAIGPMRALLAAERTALNAMARMCGIASWTRRFTDAVRGTNAQICETRKTLPGWRALDKYACAVGGATNHRMGLYDGVLLKDNHLAAAGGVEAAVKAALAGAPAGIRVQVEVESEADAERAIELGADFLLLDNCSPEEIESIVARFRDRALLEASGGIDLDNVRRYAETGVHRISIGALTHSAPSADLALEIETDRDAAAPAGAARG